MKSQRILSGLLGLLAMVILATPVMAQNFPPDEDPVPPNEFIKNVRDLNRELNRVGQTLYETEGSAYLNEDWINGKIYLMHGSQTTRMNLRYNAFKGYLEVQYNDGILILDPSTIKAFSYEKDGEKHLFMNGFASKDQHISKQDFLEVLYNGKAKFLKHHYVNRVEATEPNISTGKYVDTYIPKEDYLFVDHQGEMHDVKLRKRRVLRLFDGSMRDKIKQYAKDQNLSFREGKDVAQMIKFYDGQ